MRGRPGSRITGLVIGHIEDPPKGLPLLRFPLVGPNDAAGLYRRRLEALARVRTPWFVFLDGAEDRLADGFLPLLEALVDACERGGHAIGYMGEDEHGLARPGRPFEFELYLRDFRLIHHGVVCRTEFFRAIAWPPGCHSFEVLGYGHAARTTGAVHSPDIGYHYRPAPTGARLWPSYTRAIHNSLNWLRELPGIHTVAELKGCGRCELIRHRVRDILGG